MRFVTWYPLEEAARHAPRGPGVYRVRLASGLRDYPSGKSAMVHYGCARDLRAAVAEFSRDNEGRPWLCRHSVELTPRELADPDAMLASLLERFRRRFGIAPSPP